MSKYRVWWVPQVPMTPFRVEVPTPEEGARLLETLADYDLYQFCNDIKPDYSNAGGIETIENGEWVDYEGE